VRRGGEITSEVDVELVEECTYNLMDVPPILTVDRLYFRLHTFALILLFFAYFSFDGRQIFVVLFRATVLISVHLFGEGEGGMEMTEKLRLPFDRRSGKDRRVAYDLEYFQKGGVERRRGTIEYRD